MYAGGLKLLVRFLEDVDINKQSKHKQNCRFMSNTFPNIFLSYKILYDERRPLSFQNFARLHLLSLELVAESSAKELKRHRYRF